MVLIQERIRELYEHRFVYEQMRVSKNNQQLLENFKKNIAIDSEIFDVYRIENEISCEELNEIMIHTPHDLVTNQKYMKQIFWKHQGYLKLPLPTRKSMLKSLFLNKYFSKLDAKNIFEIVKELIQVNVEIDSMKPILVYPSTQFDDDCFASQGQLFMTHIAINEKLLNRKINGIEWLDTVYHEYDHAVVRNSSISMGVADKTIRELKFSIDLMDISEFDFNDYQWRKLINLFTPVEYHAIKVASKSVDELMGNSPDVTDSDEEFYAMTQYKQMKSILMSYSKLHGRHISILELRRLVFDFIMEHAREKCPGELACILEKYGLKESDYGTSDPKLLKSLKAKKIP